MIRIGILAMQGSVIEHINVLSKMDGVIACRVRGEEDLKDISGLILPGGESTTIGKLLKDFKLAGPIVKKAVRGMPVWGTCAGMILMAKKIYNEDTVHLGLMNITVRRNAYGSQLDSFNTNKYIPEISDKPFPLVFIRAPWVDKAGENVDILATVNEKIVAVRQNNMMATSFHPELTRDDSFHRYFVSMAKESKINVSTELVKSMR